MRRKFQILLKSDMLIGLQSKTEERKCERERVMEHPKINITKMKYIYL
jgi:hypothetical protein